MLPHLLLAYALALRFVAALQAHDVPALRALGVTERSAFAYPLRDTLDRYIRVTIDSWTVEAVKGDPDVARIRIRGSGMAINARHDWKPIPARWIVKIAPTAHGPRVALLTTEDHYIARQIIAAPDDCARQKIIAAHPDFSVHDLLHAVIDELQESLQPYEVARSDALAFVVDAAEAREDWDVESRAISHGMSRHAAETALAIAERTNRCDVIARAQFDRGNATDEAGDHEQAVVQLSRLGASAGALDDARIALKALHNLSQADILQGDLRHALLVAKSLEAQARQFGWREGEIVSRVTLGDIDWEIGDDDAAAALRRRGVTELNALGNRDWAVMITVDLAGDEMRLGHRDRAIRLMRGALEDAPARSGFRHIIIETLARMYIECGRTADAARMLRLDPQHPSQFALAELALAQHRYAQALDSAVKGKSCAGDDERCWRAPIVAAHALEQLGRRDEAIAKLEESIGVIEARRARLDANETGRTRYFAQRLEPYRDLLDLYVRAGRTHDALRVAETVKARALLDTLSLGRPDLRAALMPEEEEQRRQLEQRIDRLNRALLSDPSVAAERERIEARRELDAFETEMSLRHPVGRGLQSSELSQNLDSVVASSDAAAIEYAILPHSVVAFVVSRAADGTVSVHSKRIEVASKTVAARVAALRRGMAARSLATEGRLGQLYKLLVAPVQPWIAGKKLLFVVPDGPLWQVPFQALTAPSGQPMIAETAVAYAPSLAALSAVHAHPGAERRTLLAMGDATIGSEATAQLRSFNHGAILGNLPDAATEVRAIAAEYGPRRSEVYVHQAATETMLKESAGKFRIIHLATHGIADSRWPMFSAVVLAPTAQDDGMLEAREVADMKLDADLVVLSACDTGGGLIRSGEGVIGLSWAFFLAGCPRTVVSQWSADSKATAQLMIEFHRRLLGGASVPEALRRAQLSVRQDSRYRQPFYWAPFIVLGRP